MPKKQFQRGGKTMKPVQNNGSSDSPMQFNVPDAIAKDQKVKAKDVFVGYKKKVARQRS